ncbi:acyltransferase [Pseudomonas sp. HMWF032]|uniref:acyltransferase family protein n=1 Tax=Pseudomonas sp. HMWF032 TaxID=2056866 RepID=UPI0011B282E2|nr:acyltransferase [Pseudomonas sp. HMWF032]
MDGLRAVAIGLVMLFHAGVPLLPGANLGVDIFFVLSGYLIGRLLLAEFQAHAAIDLRRFYRRRLWRLMPPLLLLLALYAALAPLVWPDYYFHLRDGIELLLYLADIALVFGDGPQYLTHAWSLGIEERFYLLLPVLLLFLLRVSDWRRLWLFFMFLALLVTLWRFYWVQLDASGMIYYRFDMRLSGLLLGVMVAWLPPARLPDMRLVGRAMLPMMLGVLLLLVLPEHGQEWRLAYGLPMVEVLTVLVIIWVVQQPDCVLARALSRPVLVYMGKISYGLYLFHYPIMQYFKGFHSWPLVVLGGVLSAAVLAVLSWHLLERPLSKWRKGW